MFVTNMFGICRDEDHLTPGGRRAGLGEGRVGGHVRTSRLLRADWRNENVLQFLTERGLDLAGTAECTRGCPTMFLEESPEQQQLRAELKRYYAYVLTDEVRAGLERLAATARERDEAASDQERDGADRKARALSKVASAVLARSPATDRQRRAYGP